MKKSIIALLCCGITVPALSQEKTATDSVALKKEPARLFYSPKLINMNTVYMMPRHTLEFRVTHNFGDVGGRFGGVKNFFGLDNVVDVRIGFLYGLSKRITIEAARYKGDLPVQRIYVLGLKWLMLQQREKDPGHPFSLALYGNAAVATMKSGTNPNGEDFVNGFSDRLSNVAQLMIGKKMGPLSLQLTPTVIHRNHALPWDKETLFAMGGGARLHLGGRYSFLVDYSHTFRDDQTKNEFASRGTRFYDVLGVGFEILTEGHVFHINFTNATDLLENRYLPNTRSSWGKSQFRWGFTIARDFHLFYKKKGKK